MVGAKHDKSGINSKENLKLYHLNKNCSFEFVLWAIGAFVKVYNFFLEGSIAKWGLKCLVLYFPNLVK